MKPTWFLLLFTLWYTFDFTSSCNQANWWSSFDKRGWSTCNHDTYYINGLFRNDAGGGDDKIFRLEEARCCPRHHAYWNEPTGCLVADWSSSLDWNNHWSKCPAGYFLQGLYRSGDLTESYLHNIEYGKCCKPANHPYHHGRCYTQDVMSSFDNKGTSKCRDGYFMTGVYRGTCNLLYCIEKFSCCEMVKSPPLLESLADVKTRVMDATMYDLASLAHYLGYGWCGGCRGQWVGEDFRRNGDSWRADTKEPCEGYKAKDRLKMHYGDFSFGIKDIRYGTPVKQELKPQEFYTGWLRNDDPYPADVEMERSVKTARSVTHTTSSSWKKSHELGITITYTPPDLTGGVGGSIGYKFGYEHGSTTTDAEEKQQTQEFKIKTSKKLPGNTKTKWRIMVAKTRTTVPYTATIIAKFSAELDGFLRWGGGYNGKYPNFHNRHRGSHDRPTFRYKFGSAETPFYEDLERKSRENQSPWEWNNMKSTYENARWTIEKLVNKGKYEFTLSGKFEDVVGYDASIHFMGEVSNRGKRGTGPEMEDDPANASLAYQENLKEFKNQDGDPKPVNPPPPVVNIKVPQERDLSHIPIEEEILSDAKEEFSKTYSFPTGRNLSVDGSSKEEDDDNDELTHGDDVKNESSVVEANDIDVAKLVGQDLEELEKVVEDQGVADSETSYDVNDDIATSEDDSDMIPSDDVPVESVEIPEQNDNDSSMQLSDSENEGEYTAIEQPVENVGMNDQPSEDAGMSDQLDERTKRKVRAYIRQMLSEAMKNKK